MAKAGTAMTDCTETSEAVKGQEGMAKAGTAMTDCTETSEAVGTP
jgi:hypothetical protein